MDFEKHRNELHRIVATCIIYREEGDFLLCRRSLNAKIFPGKWEYPGGGMDRGDYAHSPLTLPDGWTNPIEAALRREIRDEVGIEVGPIQQVGGYWGTFAHIRDDDIAVFGIRYFAPYVSGVVTLSREHIAYQWVSAGEIKQFDCLGGMLAAAHQVERLIMYETVGGAAL